MIGKYLTSYTHALCWLPRQHTLMFVNSEVGQHDHRDCEADSSYDECGSDRLSFSSMQAESISSILSCPCNCMRYFFALNQVLHHSQSHRVQLDVSSHLYHSPTWPQQQSGPLGKCTMQNHHMCSCLSILVNICLHLL